MAAILAGGAAGGGPAKCLGGTGRVGKVCMAGGKGVCSQSDGHRRRCVMSAQRPATKLWFPSSTNK